MGVGVGRVGVASFRSRVGRRAERRSVRLSVCRRRLSRVERWQSLWTGQGGAASFHAAAASVLCDDWVILCHSSLMCVALIKMRERTIFSLPHFFIPVRDTDAPKAKKENVDSEHRRRHHRGQAGPGPPRLEKWGAPPPLSPEFPVFPSF